MRWLDSLTNSMDTKFKQFLGDSGRQKSLRIVLQSTESQRVGTSLVIEQQTTFLVSKLWYFRF